MKIQKLENEEIINALEKLDELIVMYGDIGDYLYYRALMQNIKNGQFTISAYKNELIEEYKVELKAYNFWTSKENVKENAEKYKMIIMDYLDSLLLIDSLV